MSSLDLSDKASLVSRLINYLTAASYPDIVRLPSRRFSLSRVAHLTDTDVSKKENSFYALLAAPLEPLVFLKYLFGKNQLYGFSLSPLVYQKLHSLFDKKIEHLYELFFLLRPILNQQASEALPNRLLEELLDARLLSKEENKVRSAFGVVPIKGAYVVEKMGLRSMGRSAYIFADVIESVLSRRKSTESWVDLCTGTGVYPVLFGSKVNSVYGVDIDPRALKIAELNLEANGVRNVSLLQSDGFESLQGEFDLITFNPPFGFLPRNYYDSYIGNGGYLGIEVSEKLLVGAMSHLAPQGEAHMITMSPVISGYNELFRRIKNYCRGTGLSVRARIMADMQFIDLVDFFESHGVESMQYMIVSLYSDGREESVIQGLKGLKRIGYSYYRRVVNVLSGFFPQAHDY